MSSPQTYDTDQLIAEFMEIAERVRMLDPAGYEKFARFIAAIAADLQWRVEHPDDDSAPHFRAYFDTLSHEEQLKMYADMLAAKSGTLEEGVEHEWYPPDTSDKNCERLSEWLGGSPLRGDDKDA